jgi:hypothetical protein
VFDKVDSTNSVPASPAPRTDASSPSLCASRWNAVGATAIGIAIFCPSTVVASSRRETSTSTR